MAILNSSNHSSLVIDTLCDEVDAENMVVACVYCNFHARDEQSTTALFGVLLKRVVSALEPIPEELQRAFEKSKRGLVVVDSYFPISSSCSPSHCHVYGGYSSA